MFITFEGGEGSGKSTHSKLLKRYLEKMGHGVVLTFEPGGTKIGKKLRRALLRGEKLVSRFSELFLFAADRAEHVARIIKPGLKAGKIVISDRFIDSTTAYQMAGRELPAELVKMVNRVSSEGLVPDLTLLLDFPPREGIARGTRDTKKDKFESEKMAFHKRIRKAYLSIARKEPKRVKVIGTEGTLKGTQEKIRRLVVEKLGN